MSTMTRQRGGRIVRMQRRQHQVTRLRRLDRDLGRFEVTNLTHHDDVGILTQEGFQRAGKGQAHLGVDVDLVDARQVDFRRVLGRRDVAVFRIEDVESGVERDRLTTSPSGPVTRIIPYGLWQGWSS